MDTGKFFSEKSSTRKAQLHEAKVSRHVDGRKTVASGSLSFDKADVVTLGNMRIECKRTDNGSMRFDKGWMLKLLGQCKRGEVPALNIEIQDQNWYIIRPEEFAMLLEYMEFLKEKGFM